MPAAKQTVEVDGRPVVLTNLEKILYPSGFRKAQVIDYYIRIAPVLLPHLANRPITLHRFPEGVKGQSFYGKDAPKFTPDWVATTDVPRVHGGKPIRYICVNDLPTLVWCANIASLELHPFLHRAKHLDRPDAMVFDLDPGEGATLATCSEVAFLLKSLLEINGLACFPKVSGSKGLQLYVPLNSATTYSKTRAFAQAAAIALAQQRPELAVSDMTKHLRHGKVFIDWSQNSDFKTTVGVYSLRAKAEEPFVSMPISWEELAGIRHSDDAGKLRFTPENALKRAESGGDLFSPLLTLEQSLPAKVRDSLARSMPRKRKQVDKSIEQLPKARPGFIEPMLLLRTSHLPEEAQWLYELKLDGYRAIAAKSKGKVRLWSRNENDFGTRYPTVAAALDALPDETVVDGEIVALDEAGKPSFNALQNYSSTRADLVFYLFDLLIFKGHDLQSLHLTERRRLLEEHLLPALPEPIRLSSILPGNLNDLIHAVKEQGLEGLVAKRGDSRYESGQRSGAWQKMRVNEGQEFVIGGYTVGGRTFDALVFGYYEGSRLMYVARTRNGFTPALREELMRRFHALEISTCPFANLPEKRSGRWGQGLTAAKMQDCRWLKPVLVGQFEFREWTPDNHLRHSRFVTLRDDKPAKKVRREV